MPDDPIDSNSLFFRNLPADLEIGDDAAQQRLLHEYGAVFLARGGAVPPNKVVFKDESEVDGFQSRLNIAKRQIGDHFLELQSAAMDRLMNAIDEAAGVGLSITPRGADSARRNYNDTIELWKSRVEPALIHWVGKGRMTQEQADEMRSRAPYEQVPRVFELEADGIYFAKDLSKSIIYSVAPPGASQHLACLAFDIAEFDDAKVRRILAKNFWYQTVVSDLPHFTFLGVPESELSGLGLKRVESNQREFWIPNV